MNQRDGVLVLSTAAGSHGQLEDGALSVDPMDVAGTAEALYRAVTMATTERIHRAEALRGVAKRDDPTVWLNRQIEDLLSLR